MGKAKKVFVPALAGKTANLPHTEQGPRPVSFRENGEAYIKDVKRDKQGRDVRENQESVPVLDEEGNPVLDEEGIEVTELDPRSGNVVTVERPLTTEEVEAVAEHLHLHGVTVV